MGLVVSAQPGGHGASRALDGTILVRTGALDEIWVDAEAGVARVGSGVKWGQLLAALDGTGRIALAGSNPDVSVVGYLLGGGLSWFGRKYGIAAHTLRAVELVDGTGEHRWVTDHSDPELMWALRGGGGEFGVVTRVEVALPAEPQVAGGKLMFPIGDAPGVLRAFADVTASAPEGLTCWAWIAHFPDAPFMPEPIRGGSFVGVDATWLGSPAEGADLLAPLRAAGTVLMDSYGPVPIGRLGEVAAEPTDPTPALDWAGPIGELDSQAIDRLVGAVGDRSSTALTVIQVRHVGGALARGGVQAAADRLSSPYVAYAFGVPGVPELVEPIRGSLAALAAAVTPSEGKLTLTFLPGGAPLSGSFDDATLARLRAVKERVDPGGVIRGNHPLG
jgi:hypothetical protein